MTDRRAFLTAALIAPVAIATPAVAATPLNPAAEFLVTQDAYNANLCSEEQYLASMDKLYEWRPETAEDFVKKFSAWVGNPEQDGWPPRSLMLTFVRDAHRLA